MARASAWKARACRPSALRNMAPTSRSNRSTAWSDMLDSGAARLAGELRQAGLVDEMSSAWCDADATYMFQPLDQAEHGRRCGGLRHLSQPGEPALAGF